MNRKEIGKYSKEKGKRGERELAKLLREYGFSNARRTAQYCGKTGDASDIVGIDNFHVEVKYVEKLNIWLAIEQAERDADESFAKFGDILKPVVIFKRKRTSWYCVLSLEDFVELVQIYLAFKNVEMKALDAECLESENDYTKVYETMTKVQRSLFQITDDN